MSATLALTMPAIAVGALGLMAGGVALLVNKLYPRTKPQVSEEVFVEATETMPADVIYGLDRARTLHEMLSSASKLPTGPSASSANFADVTMAALNAGLPTTRRRYFVKMLKHVHEERFSDKVPVRSQADIVAALSKSNTF
jgi:hypothetical protein